MRTMASLVNTEKTFTINVPWGKIAGVTWGNSSDPPVLMAPGRLVPCTSFRPLVQLLPDCFFYVAIDLPGNGYSDRLPPGIRYSYFDLVPAIEKVVKHFKWEKLMYVAHSLGTVVGAYFDLAYPGRFTRVVHLDPIPLYFTITPQQFEGWYKEFFGDHYDDAKYAKYVLGKETAPKYKLDDIKIKLKEAHHITNEETLEHILDRYIEPAGDGLYRFTYDQSMKNTTLTPFSPSNLQGLLTYTKVPIFAVFAKNVVDRGVYSKVPFALDSNSWPNGNYKFKIVDGYHDVHMTNPEYMADDISKFLLEEFRAKL
ncbi:serine hydrolase-like protein isoform X2 [Zerene cesonia]|uniref:serine hydrolase-like protein isoform X2 n=1 Tax=Zerene cesonia TaxID=33412 RepID=UPI0018E5A18F|nr:serine hydrolase-like protein isoform X2 [Zerene cesonia]